MEFFKILFSKFSLAKARRDMDQAKSNLGKKNIEIEKLIHSMKPEDQREKFVPSFGAWCQSQRNQELNIEEALDKYIDKYDLLKPGTPDEPIELTRTAARLDVLSASGSIFGPSGEADLNSYILRLKGILIMQRGKWKIDQKMKETE